MADRQTQPGDGLNERQRAAVEFEGGPFAVLAGPGTGKTRVITRRVARLIERGVEPRTIVALTFTVKAARQLRERLADLCGGPAADAVHAHTFHGFGLNLIQRFKDYLGLPPELKLIDPPRVRRLLRELIARHGLYREIAGAGIDSAVAEAVRAIDALGNNGTFPDEAAAYCARWGVRLESADHGLDAGALAAERARQGAFAEHAAAYGHFARACAARGWLTFDDLILHPVQLLRGVAPAAAMCRDGYRHFVIDEFQDVNAGQIEMLRLLCPPGARGPDLCVVGDDDQAIYEFRGADDRALAKFERIWGIGKDQRLPLSENYRSEAPVVAVANAVMSRATDRFAPDKVVELPREKRSTSPRTGACVECVTLEDDGESGPTIAAMILADRGAGGTGAAPWSRYAVIARGHTDLDRIGAALELEGIPVRRSRGPAAGQDAAVLDVLRWVEVLVPGDEGVTLAVRWLLTRPPFAVPSARVTEWVRKYLAERLLRVESAGFLAWLSARGPLTGEHAATVTRLAALREELVGATATMRADAAVLEIIGRADVAHAEMLPARDRAARVSRLAELVRFVREHVGAMDPPRDLASFWAYYGELTDEEKELRAGGQDRVDGDGENGDDGPRPDAVMLLTAHGAKGLEFDTVFVPRVRPHGFPRSRSEDEVLPEGLVDRAGDERSREDRRAAEERRVFYVACTRAERRLVLLAEARKARSKSVDYFNELTLDAPGASIVVPRTGAEVMAAAAAAGVKLAALGPVIEPGPGRLSREEILAHAQRGARQLAAQALEVVDRGDATPETIAQAERALRDAAERTAVVAAVRETGAAPAWAQGSMGEYARRLALAAAEGEGDPATAIFAPMKGPLKLSYTAVQEFEMCPRCYYLRRVLGFPEAQGARQIVGQVVHEALAAFYRRVQEAEAAGGRPPGLDEALELGRERFAARAADLGPGGERQLDQVLAQLRLWHAKLYDPRHEVEQIEHTFTFEYPHTVAIGDAPEVTMTHRFEATIDRLDRLPGAGHRIVDYKTGKAKKALLEPEATDLQLGVYAMALGRHQAGGPESAGEKAVGTAEYWVLSTGERGAIDLSAINYKRVRARIDKVIAAMLRGEFAQGKECWGLCTMVL